jgi:hypothetical protein
LTRGAGSGPLTGKASERLRAQPRSAQEEM